MLYDIRPCVLLLRLTMVAIEQYKESRDQVKFKQGIMCADALAFFLLCDVAISSAFIVIVVSVDLFL